jgi:hypothetical protein
MEIAVALAKSVLHRPSETPARDYGALSALDASSCASWQLGSMGLRTAQDRLLAQSRCFDRRKARAQRCGRAVEGLTEAAAAGAALGPFQCATKSATDSFGTTMELDELTMIKTLVKNGIHRT